MIEGDWSKELVMRSEDDDVIRVEALVKTFGGVRALDGLDLEVRRGEIHGLSLIHI